MYVYFKVMDGDIKVIAVFLQSVLGMGQGFVSHTADVVWRVTPERIEWVKDRWNEQHTDTGRKYGYAFIQDVTNGMSMFAVALCAMLGIKRESLGEQEPSGTTRRSSEPSEEMGSCMRVNYTEDSCAEG